MPTPPSFEDWSAAQAGPAAGATPTYVKTPAGETVELRDPSQLAAAKAQGYTLATAEDIGNFKLQEKYGDTRGQLQAAGAGFLRGISFGASDVALRALGKPAEDLQGLQEANPTASGLGEAAGVGAGMLIPGALPARLATAGRAVSAATEAALPTAESLVGRIAKHAIAQGAGLATEGAAYGMGHEVSEAALGDPNQTASSVIQHVGLSALLGGGLGGVFGAGEVVIPKLVSGAGQSLKRLTDKIGEYYPELVEKMTGVPSEYADAVVKARATTQEAAADAIDAAMPGHGVELPMEGPRPRVGPEPVAPNRPPVVEPPQGWAREVSQNLGETHDALIDAAKEGAKIRPVEIEQLAAEINPTAARMSATQAYKSLSASAKQMAADELTFGNMGAKIGRIAERIKDAIEGGTPVDIYNAMTEAKRLVSKLAKPGKFAEQLIDRDAIHAARGLATDLGKALTDEATWGETAARTAKFNAAKSKFDTNTRLFRKYFTTDGKFDPGKAERYFANLGKPGMDKVHEALEGFLRSGSAYKDVIAESAANAGMDFNAADLQRLTDKAGKVIGQARQSVAMDEHFAQQQAQHAEAMKEFAARDKAAAKGFDQSRAAQRAEFDAAESARAGQVQDYARRLSSSPGSGPSWFEVGMMGHLLSAVPGGRLLKAGLYGYKMSRGLKGMSVTGTVGHLARLEGLNQTLGNTIRKSADALVKGGASVSRVSRGEAAAGIGEAHGRSADEQRAIFKQIMGRVNQLSDPQTQMDHLQQSTNDLYPHAPQTTGALQQKTSAAIQYLKQTAPGRDPMTLLDTPREPSSSEVAKWLRRVEAIDDPASLLKKAAAGTLTKEHVEAAEAVHPELLASMRQDVMSAIAGHKGSVPMQARNGLGLLLGQPVTLSRQAASLQTTAGLYKSVGAGQPQGAPNQSASKASKISLAERSAEGTTSQRRSAV